MNSGERGPNHCAAAAACDEGAVAAAPAAPGTEEPGPAHRSARSSILHVKTSIPRVLTPSRPRLSSWPGLPDSDDGVLEGAAEFPELPPRCRDPSGLVVSDRPLAAAAEVLLLTGAGNSSLIARSSTIGISSVTLVSASVRRKRP